MNFDEAFELVLQLSPEELEMESVDPFIMEAFEAFAIMQDAFEAFAAMQDCESTVDGEAAYGSGLGSGSGSGFC